MATKKKAPKKSTFSVKPTKTAKQKAAGGGRARGYGKVKSMGGVRVGAMGRHSYSGTSHEPVK